MRNGWVGRPQRARGPLVENAAAMGKYLFEGLETLRKYPIVGDIRGKLGSDPAVVALIAEGDDDSVPFVVAATPTAQDLGLSANDLVKTLGAAVNGRGGGKADLAQGSGSGASGIDAALAALRLGRGPVSPRRRGARSRV